MKRLLRALANRPLFVAIGVASAAVLVWFVGPLLTLAGMQPLASEPARWSAIAVLVAAALVYALVRAVRSARRNAKLIDGLAEGPRAKAVPGAQDVAQIGQRFDEAIQLLKSTHLGGRRPLLGALAGRPFIYQLPWYVIIGAPGAGKTTALVNSGLEFPLATKLGKQPVRGVGGTRNCDWWFASEAVLIDTAGRFTTQDSDRDSDRAGWFGFLDLLARHRPRRPINGVLLTLSVTDLLGESADERTRHMRTLRERVEEVHARLGGGIPIYVMITKVDLLAGFMEFFADFDKDERAQVWGVTFPYTQGRDVDPLARLGAELAALEKRLDECLIERLQGEHDRERRAAIYAFPQQWRLLRETLVGFLQGTFAGVRGEIQPLVRGVYFTSATQEGTPVDRALGELARAMGLKSRVVAAARPSGKTFFVTRFLRDVVFAEAGLAGTNLRLRRGRALLQWGAFGAVGVLVVAALGVAWHAYAVNRDRVLALQAGLGALDADVARARGSAPNDLPALVPALDALQALGAGGQTPGQPAAHGSAFTLGLDQSAILVAAAQDAYQHVLRDVLQRRIAARLEERLRAGRPDNVGLIYEALKAYLMLYGGRNFDAAALRGYLFADWDTTLPRTVGAAEREGLHRHLDSLLAGGEVGAPARADRALIDKSRALVASVPLAQRIYDRLKSLDLGPSAPAFSVAAAGGAAAAQVFTRTSGQSLAQGIPALYSRTFLTQSLRPRSQDVLRQFSDESPWVLGADKANAEKQPATLPADIEQLYLADYARVWDEYLRDVKLVKADNLAKNAHLAQLLGGSESPLAAYFGAVGREVGVLVPTTEAASANTGAVPAARAGDVAATTERFAALARFIAAQPSPMQEAVGLLAKLATHLNAVEDALKRKASPPASDVTRELVALAARAPEPLAAMLAQIATTSAGQVFATRRDEISRLIGTELGPACTRALGARFPLVRKATEEMSREEFARVFAAGGLIDNFFQRQLAPYVDTSGATWSVYRPDGSTGPAESLQAFQRAQAIREAFFSDAGRVFGTRLELRVLEMDPGVGALVLDVDGQVLRFTRDAKQPLSVRWPGPNAPGGGYVQARLFTTTPGSLEPVGLDGPWALLRLLARLRSETGPAPDRVPVQFNFAGKVARLELKSPTHSNPARLLAQDTLFQCPQRL